MITGFQGIQGDNSIIVSPVQPSGIVEDRLWVDESDNNYQGTIFDKLNSQIIENTPYLTNDGRKYTIYNPYADGGNLILKGQMHCHTTNSDGANSPFDVVTAYKNAGYDFIFITDHDVITPDPGVAGITFIQGCEQANTDRHVTCFDITTKEPTVGVTPGVSSQNIINFHRNNNVLTCLAHTNWVGAYVLDRPEIESFYGLNFIELYNNLVNKSTNTHSIVQANFALAGGKRVFLTCVDDCHNVLDPNQFNGGCVYVFAKDNTKASIMHSLRKGNFMATISAGTVDSNAASVSLDENIITVTTTKNARISFRGKDDYLHKLADPATSASYNIKGDEGFIRVSIGFSDLSGTLYYQPFFIEIQGHDDRNSLDVDIRSTPPASIKNFITNGTFKTWGSGDSIIVGDNMNPLGSKWVGRNGTGIPYTAQHIREYNYQAKNSLDYCRLNFTEALPTPAYEGLNQQIYGVIRSVGGVGKYVTVQFLMRCSKDGKRVGIHLREAIRGIGTIGGDNKDHGANITLRTWWQPFAVTIPLYGKSSYQAIGTFDDDSIRLGIIPSWAGGYGTWMGSTDGDSEAILEPMTMDIAEVQLVAGKKAQSFIPPDNWLETYTNMTAFEKSYEQHITPGTPNEYCGLQRLISKYNKPANTAISIAVAVPFQAPKPEKQTSVILYALDGTKNAITINQTTLTGATVSMSYVNQRGFNQIEIDNTSAIGITQWDTIQFHWIATAN